jgi:hypothetical protein
MDEKGENLTLQKVFYSYLQVIFLHVVKSYNMGPLALLPLQRKMLLHIFITLRNPLPCLGLNLQTLVLVGSPC